MLELVACRLIRLRLTISTVIIRGPINQNALPIPHVGVLCTCVGVNQSSNLLKPIRLIGRERRCETTFLNIIPMRQRTKVGWRGEVP